MTDLHGWITQQIERREREVREGRIVLDEEGRYLQHTSVDDPAAVLRRCEADRRVLARHRLATEWTWALASDTPCHGCGTSGDCDDPATDQLNECPELLDLAHAHGITPEILAGLDKPQMPPRPTVTPRGPEPDTSRVPPALRGPNWKGAP